MHTTNRREHGNSPAASTAVSIILARLPRLGERCTHGASSPFLAGIRTVRTRCPRGLADVYGRFWEHAEFHGPRTDPHQAGGSHHHTFPWR